MAETEATEIWEDEAPAPAPKAIYVSLYLGAMRLGEIGSAVMAARAQLLELGAPHSAEITFERYWDAADQVGHYIKAAW